MPSTPESRPSGAASAGGATTAERASQPAADGGYSHRQILTILSGLMMGMFLAALDQTVVSTAIRTIGDDLKGLSVQAWVTTAFLITSTIATPLYGKLSDIYGRKPFFMLAIVIFITGSALCGIATSMYELAAFRAFQGLGAGGLFSLALTIVADIIPPRERARYQGYFMAVFATSSVLGPLVGGFLAGQASILGLAGWRWIFWVNVPLGVIALYVVFRNLHLVHRSNPQRIDWAGAGLLIVALVPLLIIAEQGRTWGWTSAGAFLCYVVGVAGLGAFARVEIAMGPAALIPFRLFNVSAFRTGAMLSFVLGIVMFGGIISLPLYLQLVQGASPTQSGLLMLPLVLGLMSASLGAGRFTSRTGRYKVLPILGTAAMGVGMFLLHTVGADTALVITDVYMLIFGAGLGLCMQTVVLAMQNAVPATDIGVATSSATFFRQVGGTLGTAVFLSILFSSVGHKVASAYRAAFAGGDADFTKAISNPAIAGKPSNAHFLAGLKNPVSGGININDTRFLNGLDHAIAHPFRVGFSQSMDLVFLVAVGVAVIAFVVAWLVPEVPLRKVSGQQATLAEAAAPSATQTAVGSAAGAPAGLGTPEEPPGRPQSRAEPPPRST
ncbi:MAG: MFS transporter [Actinomycetota bacterium]|nr:MFS transporter [Actinomycetota bacterium]